MKKIKDAKERILMGLNPPRWVKCEIYPNCKSCLDWKRACIFRYKDIDDNTKLRRLRNETCDKTLKQIKANLGRLKRKDKRKYLGKSCSDLEEVDFDDN